LLDQETPGARNRHDTVPHRFDTCFPGLETLAGQGHKPALREKVGGGSAAGKGGKGGDMPCQVAGEGVVCVGSKIKILEPRNIICVNMKNHLGLAG
jgi:hypothetical protein